MLKIKMTIIREYDNERFPTSIEDLKETILDNPIDFVDNENNDISVEVTQ
jgi:hypothetical protein